MAAEYNSKVVLSDGTVLIDLTADTITAADLQLGVTAHGADGAPITGTSTKNADTSDATVTAAEILSGAVGYGAAGTAITGTMPNNGAVSGTIDDKDTPYVVPAGYHDGSGTVSLDPTEAAKLDPAKILKDWTILGVTGTLEPASGVTAQTKNATPSWSSQSILPDAGYDYLNQVNIAAIPIAYVENPAGGYTVTIG